MNPTSFPVVAMLFVASIAAPAQANNLPKNTNQSLKPSLRSVISGGSANFIPKDISTGFIGGGFKNRLSDDDTTVSGGAGNTASGYGSTVAGGVENVANGYISMVPGGSGNSAGHNYSFAAGRRAKTTAGGQFVWADNQDKDFAPGWAPFETSHTFNVRARNGVQFTSGETGNHQTIFWIPGATDWTTSSDVAGKENFRAVDPRDVLQRVASVPITEWSYKGYHQRNIGPMAQDWHQAFPSISENDKLINRGNIQGVALAAIQGLVEELKQRDKRIEELSARLEALEKRLESLPPAP